MSILLTRKKKRKRTNYDLIVSVLIQWKESKDILILYIYLLFQKDTLITVHKNLYGWQVKYLSIQVQSLLPTNTNQLNKPKNHIASLALKSMIIIVGNDMSVLIGLDLSCKSTFPDFDQFSPSASDTIVSTEWSCAEPFEIS